MKYKVLWIEDGAFVEVATFAGAVLTSMKYDLEVSIDISDALGKIRTTEYDAVIVDIRIPPGNNMEWKKIYNQSGYNKNSARLGMQLLFSLLKPEEAEVKLENIPSWVSAKKFGVFTVESRAEVKNDMVELGIYLYLQKKTNMNRNDLLEFIEKIIGPSAANSNKGGDE
ncbi:MAG: hypothetical protein KAT34_18265 [Candidatus Aminicenantes bacterium]|nr:hypothetical protein [Candidatus Aminicenantes bacterium]